MTIQLAVFDFLVAQEAAAGSSAAIKGAVIHADKYEELIETGVTKWIRIVGNMPSQPKPINDNAGGGFKIRHFNSLLEIQCIVRPQTPAFEHRREAQTVASKMADELHLLIINNQTLGDTNGIICDSQIENQLDESVKIGTVRHEASFLMIQINI